MDKELIDRAWACLPKEFKEEVKKMFEEDKKHPEIHTTCGITTAYHNNMGQRLIDLFGVHNLTSDTEGDDEMLTVSRKQIDALQGEIFKAIMDAHDADDWQDAAHYILDVMPRSFAALFGSKCLPDEGTDCTPIEVGVAENTTTTQTSAEPKFKVGDKVRIINDWDHGCRYKGEITEIVYVDKDDSDKTYKVDIYNETLGGGLWYRESDLEPYTEPSNEDSATLRAESVKESRIASEETHLRNLSQETANCDKHFDNILKDGFVKERRLNIAAQIVASMIGSDDWTTWRGSSDKEIWHNMAKSSLEIADALIAEAQKRESK